MDRDYELAQKALNAEEEALYAAIGASLEAGRLGAGPDLDEAEKAKRGKAWFNERISLFRTTVCTNSNVRAIASAPSSDPVLLVLTIGDVIAQATGNVPPFFVSALTMKIGLNKICEREWSQQ